MTDIAEILHNIADHTETFYRFLSEPGVADDIKSRLIDHIVLEEKENSVQLQDLHSAAPTALTQKMLDHSFVLQRVMSDITMPLDLKQELLHHFIEEHQEWQRQIIGTASGHAELGTTSSAPAGHATQTTHQPGGQRAAHGGGGHGGQGGGHGGHGGHGGGGGAHGGTRPEQHTHQQSTSNKAHDTSKTSNQSGAAQEPETREWTVGPLWNQGG